MSVKSVMIQLFSAYKFTLVIHCFAMSFSQLNVHVPFCLQVWGFIENFITYFDKKGCKILCTLCISNIHIDN